MPGRESQTMTTFRQHQQRAARAQKGKATPAQIEARRRNMAKARAARLAALAAGKGHDHAGR
jgi:hypothetical protein